MIEMTLRRFVNCVVSFFVFSFRKIDGTLSEWRNKLEESEKYQKTKTSLNEGGKRASSTISSKATSIK